MISLRNHNITRVTLHMSERMIYQTEQTREKIIQTAEKLFISNGFAETQMKDIADAVSVSRYTLYRYFQDKYDLGFAILTTVLIRQAQKHDRLLNEIETETFRTVLDGLQVLMETWTSPDTPNDDYFIAEFDGYYAGSRIPAEFRIKLAEVLPDNFKQRLNSIIRLGQTSGCIRNDLSSEYLAVTILNTIPIFYRRMLLREKALLEIDTEEIPQLTPVLIQLIIDGLKPQKQS